MKIFCMVVLCACLFIACEKDNDDYEPVKPPVEQPENPVEPEKPDEPEKPEKPAIPPSTDNIINFKIGICRIRIEFIIQKRLQNS